MVGVFETHKEENSMCVRACAPRGCGLSGEVTCRYLVVTQITSCQSVRVAVHYYVDQVYSLLMFVCHQNAGCV